MELHMFSADEESYIEDFIFGLEWDLCLRVRTSRLKPHNLSTAYSIARIEEAMMSIESFWGTRHIDTEAPNVFDKMPDPILGAESESQHNSVVTNGENVEHFDRENKDGLGGEDSQIDIEVECDDNMKLGEDNTQNDEICGLPEPGLHLLVSATKVPLEVEAQKSFNEMPALISTAVIEDHQMPIDVDGEESRSPSYNFGSKHDFSMELKEEKLHKGEIYGLLEDGLYMVVRDAQLTLFESKYANEIEIMYVNHGNISFEEDKCLLRSFDNAEILGSHFLCSKVIISNENGLVYEYQFDSMFLCGQIRGTLLVAHSSLEGVMLLFDPGGSLRIYMPQVDDLWWNLFINIQLVTLQHFENIYTTVVDIYGTFGFQGIGGIFGQISSTYLAACFYFDSDISFLFDPGGYLNLNKDSDVVLELNLLLVAIVKSVSFLHNIIRKPCCSTVKSLFLNKGQQGATAVRTIADFDYQFYLDAMEGYMSLPYNGELVRVKKLKVETNRKVKHSKKRKKFQKQNKCQEGEKMTELVSKTKGLGIWRHAMLPSNEERTLNYTCGSCPLLAPCLNRIGNCSHFIDLNFMSDPTNKLKKFAAADNSLDVSENYSQSLTISARWWYCNITFQDDACISWRKKKKHLFRFNHFGKPIYSRYGIIHKLAGFFARWQTIFSFLETGGDPENLVGVGEHHIIFLVKSIILWGAYTAQKSHVSLQGSS